MSTAELAEGRRGMGMGKRWRWRVWRAQRWVRLIVKALVAVALVVVSLFVGDDLPLPTGNAISPRRRVNAITKLSTPPLATSGEGWLLRLYRWVHNGEVHGRLTVDPDEDVFLWEAREQDAAGRPIARALESLAAVRVTERWTYRFGRRTVVVVSLPTGADMWLTGKVGNVALQQVGR